jgi:hypothetical protein
MSESLRGKSRKCVDSEENESIINLEEVVGSKTVTREDAKYLQENMIFYFNITPPNEESCKNSEGTSHKSPCPSSPSTNMVNSTPNPRNSSRYS